ncbi:MAG TPA: hypothetical protein VGX37_01930 [Allosphingosinicella sp.]|nr:hypothetical protein [Allosphingosinicella sp.]
MSLLRSGAVAALTALALASAPAAAERAQARLSVTAIVVEACVVSTSGMTPSDPAVACSSGSQSAVTVEPSPPSPPATPGASAAETAQPAPPKVVTISY